MCLYFYTNTIRLLNVLKDDDNLLSNIIDVLPLIEDYQSEKLLKRLQLEFTRLKQETYFFIAEEIKNGTPKEVLTSFEDEMALYEKKQQIIISLNDINKQVEDETKEDTDINHLIFVENSNGRIKVFEDIKSQGIDPVFYQGLKDSFNSIVTGNFKDRKKLNYRGISEVRNLSNQTRVLFDYLAPNYCAVIGVIIKKCDFNSIYSTTLDSYIDRYQTVKDYLKSSLNDPEFLSSNAKNQDKLFEMLTPAKKKVK